MSNKKVYIRPEDVIRLILKNLNKWRKEDKIEDNLKKMLWYFEDTQFDKMGERFGI